MSADKLIGECPVCEQETLYAVNGDESDLWCDCGYMGEDQDDWPEVRARYEEAP